MGLARPDEKCSPAGSMERFCLYNTLTRRVEELEQGEERCGIYCCGPTVYGPAHIGNFRTFVAVDLLVRALTLAGRKPFLVRNLTDVDDKTIAGSAAAGQPLDEFTRHWTEVFRRDCAALNLLAPDREPLATEHIEEQLALIGQLMNKDIAYERDGSVYFRIGAWKDYGRLSRLAERELLLRESDFSKCAAEDFVLWKAARDSDGPVRWPSPWGPGRPGWHIECSAMALKHLGSNFPIHCGGVDLIFPHHENEIAQSEAATGKPLARLWFHVAHLHLGGEKMSKSLGNLHTVADMGVLGHTPETLRLALSSCHYRQVLNFQGQSLHSARKALAQLRRVGEILQNNAGTVPMAPQFLRWKDVWEAVQDDLNLPLALGRLFGSLRSWNPEMESGGDAWAEWQRLLFLLGLRPSAAGEEPVPPEEVCALAEERLAARKAKDFARSDILRQRVEGLGWALRDTADGYVLARFGRT